MLAKRSGIGIGRINGKALVRHPERVDGIGDFII
jgi:hypothetical protein